MSYYSRLHLCAYRSPFHIARGPGIDIDWVCLFRTPCLALSDSTAACCVVQEYPNSEGAGNPHSSSDAANFLTFLTSLRTALGKTKIISAAVPHLPWLGTNGKPLTNVASYAAQLTYLNIMYVYAPAPARGIALTFCMVHGATPTQELRCVG